MTTLTNFIDYWNGRVRHLSILDVKLAQGAAMGFVLIIVKLCPQIMNVSIWWFVAAAVLCALHPTYVMCVKEHHTGHH